MTWLTGQTTWQNVVSDLHKLIAGEIADGQGNTAAVGDRWVRPISGQDFLRSPDSSAVALGNMSKRAGYWQAVGVTATGGALGTVCRQTAIGTGATGSPTRWMTLVVVNTANTVAGNYSTAQVQVQVYDMDTASLYSNISNSLAADGTLATGAMAGTIQVTDPSGILPTSARWIRAFTTTYRGGIDFFGPLYGRRTANPTFSVNPPGTQGTDWSLAEIVTLSAPQPNGSYYNAMPSQGIGVLTNTYLTGALYTFTYAAALHSLRMVASATVGQIDAYWSGGMAMDGATLRPYHNQSIPSWLRPYQTPASVTNASLIQYWISVKADKVVIILNADPGQSGKMTAAACGTYTPLMPTIDKFPVWCSGTCVDHTVNTPPVNSLYYWWNPNSQRKRLNGEELAVRDWQTGWQRTDWVFVNGSNPYIMSTDVEHGFPSISTSYRPLTTLGVMFDPSGNSGVLGIVPARQPKPSALDGNWWLYGIPITRWATDTNYWTQPGMDSYPIAGNITDRVLCIPGDGWANADEIAETGGRTWLLIAPDYTGLPGRHRIGAAIYSGGIAVLEE